MIEIFAARGAAYPVRPVVSLESWFTVTASRFRPKKLLVIT
jgi:hypothetical protein